VAFRKQRKASRLVKMDRRVGDQWCGGAKQRLSRDRPGIVWKRDSCTGGDRKAGVSVWEKNQKKQHVKRGRHEFDTCNDSGRDIQKKGREVRSDKSQQKLKGNASMEG